MNAQYMRDPQEGPDAGVCGAGLKVLVGGPGDPGGEVDLLLRQVLPQSADSDAVADGAALSGKPGVVIGQAGHALNAERPMIISQPVIPGIL